VTTDMLLGLSSPGTVSAVSTSLETWAATASESEAQELQLISSSAALVDIALVWERGRKGKA